LIFVRLSFGTSIGCRKGEVKVEALVAVLLAWIHATAGYAVPDTAPRVEFVQPRLIADIMCDGQPKCPVLAMYLHGDTIFLDDRLDVQRNDYHTSILLHELVHYVQQQSGRFAENDCDGWVKEEQEAFRAQAAWLWSGRFTSLNATRSRAASTCARVISTATRHPGRNRED